MTDFFEIPLSPDPQTFVIALGGEIFRLRFTYATASGGGWILDIFDSNGNALVCGIPLVTGADLLEQYRHLGIPGGLYVQGDPDPDDVPTFENLGSDSTLFWVSY